MFSPDQIKQKVQNYFTNSALPSLIQYVKIQNQSRAFDPNWQTNGLLLKAAQHIKKWADQFGVKGLTSQIIVQQGLSPLIYTQVKGDIDQTIFFYGHYDKQPPFQGWNQGLGPYTPVIKDGKLYGRGGADDGYATYGALIAIKSLQDLGIKIPRCVIITEGDQQSGSAHIKQYILKLKERIGNPKLFICLDSGALDYQYPWITTSLRGMLAATIRVDVLSQGVHSGDASGVVPSAFRIMRQILSRLQDQKTGQINQAFQVDIPPVRYQQMYQLVKNKGKDSIKNFPLLQGVNHAYQNTLTSIIQRGWKAQMAIIGADGLPQAKTAGNVMLPYLQLRVSIRLPPTKDAGQAQKAFRKIVCENPPFGSKVSIKDFMCNRGYNSPSYSQQVNKVINQAAMDYFNKPKLSICEGMSIPFLNILGQYWPKGQFVVTGLLGPQSNAHGPNQFMHIDYTKKLIGFISGIVGNTFRK